MPMAVLIPEFTIKVNELPKFSIQAQTGICSGETDTLRASSDVAGEKYSYFWVNNGEPA